MSECEGRIGTIDWVNGFFGSIKHPLLWLIIIGTLIHLFAAVFQIVFDNDYWALVIRNIEAGNGLYEVTGYYYTPVWGYVLGLVSALQTVFLDLGMDVLRVVEFFFAEDLPYTYYSATVPSIAFSISTKAPLILSDLILAYLVRSLVVDSTGDVKKGNLAFILIYMCPLLIGASCITAMPDTIAAMFTVMTVVLLRRDHHFLAGMTFCIAVLTKFFPVFLFFPLVAYVLMRSRDNGTNGVRNVSAAAFGAVVALLVVFAPQLIEGSIESCFQFLTDRTGGSQGDSILSMFTGRMRIIVYGAITIASLYVGYYMYKKCRWDADRALMFYGFLMMALCMIYPPTPQYIVILMPFLVYWAVTEDRRYITSWWMISLFGLFFALSSNFLVLLPIAAWTGLIDVSVLSEYFASFVLGDFPVSAIWSIVGGTLTYIGILSIFWIMFGENIRRIGGRTRD